MLRMIGLHLLGLSIGTLGTALTLHNSSHVYATSFALSALLWLFHSRHTFSSVPSKSRFLATLQSPSTSKIDDTCIFCKDSLEAPAQLPCNHILCSDCVHTLANSGRDKCVICDRRLFRMGIDDSWHKVVVRIAMVFMTQCLLFGFLHAGSAGGRYLVPLFPAMVPEAPVVDQVLNVLIFVATVGWDSSTQEWLGRWIISEWHPEELEDDSARLWRRKLRTRIYKGIWLFAMLYMRSMLLEILVSLQTAWNLGIWPGVEDYCRSIE